MTAFLNTSDKNGLINICESLCGIGDGGISGDTTLLKQFTNYCNITIGVIRQQLLKVDRSWKADDYNYTTVPDAPISFVAAQFDYQLPVAATGNNMATLLRVNHVYYISGTERVYIEPMSRREQYNATTTGTPTRYYFDGKNIYFDVAPSSTFISSVTQFHVDFSRLDDPFVYGDTTQEPGFIASYHHLVAFGACSLHLTSINPNIAREYASWKMKEPGRLEYGIMDLMDAHSRMNGDKRHVMTPRDGIATKQHI